MSIALKVNDLDNVATAFDNGICRGDKVEIRDKKGGTTEICVGADIPYGHKIALRDIRKGEHIIKYGESIGLASVDIKEAQYVHVHNIESERGRGDLT